MDNNDNRSNDMSEERYRTHLIKAGKAFQKADDHVLDLETEVRAAKTIRLEARLQLRQAIEADIRENDGE